MQRAHTERTPHVYKRAYIYIHALQTILFLFNSAEITLVPAIILACRGYTTGLARSAAQALTSSARLFRITLTINTIPTRGREGQLALIFRPSLSLEVYSHVP